MYCKYCGATVAEDSMFCEKCGKKMNEDPNIKVDPGQMNQSQSPEPDNIIEGETVSAKSYSISDIWIWCLAIIPVGLVTALYYFKIIPQLDKTLNIVIIFCLNSLFLVLDKNILNGYSIYPSKWFLGFVIPPLYIIIRETKTNRNFVPAVWWSVMYLACIYIMGWFFAS